MSSSGRPKPQKLLVIITLGLLALLVLAELWVHRSKPKPVVSIETFDQPVLGADTACVELVIFEEPKCSACKTFSNEIFPKIKEKYIDTGRVSYHTFIVSFLPNSMPAANALLCIYNPQKISGQGNSDAFYRYLDFLYQNQPEEDVDWAKPPLLAKFAHKAGVSINDKEFIQCIEHNSYSDLIESNTNYGQKLMEGKLATPALFINGEFLGELSLDELSKLLDKKLKECEKKP